MNLEERLAREDWPRLAFAVKQAADGKCQLCGRRFPYPFLGLHAHHNTYVRLGRERMTDLVALCGPCHAHTEWRKKYGDLVEVRTVELLGIVDVLAPTIAEVHEFYWQHKRRWERTVDELKEEMGLFLAASAAEREWNEGKHRRAG